jgi:hypothetical protein
MEHSDSTEHPKLFFAQRVPAMASISGDAFDQTESAKEIFVQRLPGVVCHPFSLPVLAACGHLAFSL